MSKHKPGIASAFLSRTRETLSLPTAPPTAVTVKKTVKKKPPETTGNDWKHPGTFEPKKPEVKIITQETPPPPPRPMPTGEKLYTTQDIALRLGVTERTIRNYIAVGQIQTIPWVRRGFRITEDEITRIEREGIDTTGLRAGLTRRKK